MLMSQVSYGDMKNYRHRKIGIPLPSNLLNVLKGDSHVLENAHGIAIGPLIIPVVKLQYVKKVFLGLLDDHVLSVLH